MRINYIVMLTMLSFITGCSSMPDWFGENNNEPKLEGKRLSVLKLENKLAADKEIGNVTVNIPPEQELRIWANSNGSQYDYPANIKLVATSGASNESRVIPLSRKSYYLTATPVVVEDKIFVMDGIGRVFAYNKDDLKKPLWTKNLSPLDEKEELVGGGMAYQNGKIFITSGHKDILALNIETGKEIWRNSLNNIARAAPIIEGDKLLVLTIDNKLYALSLLDGSLLWMHEGAEETIGIFGAASMASSQGIVVIPHSSGQLHGLDINNDGAEIWSVNLAYSKTSLAGFSFSDIDVTPIIRGENIYVAGNMGLIFAVGLKDGTLHWQQEIKGVKSIWVSGDFLYVVDSSNDLICLYNKDGRVKWIKSLEAILTDKKSKLKNSFVGPVMAEGKLILVSVEGKLLYISPLHGEILAEKKVEKNVKLLPVIVGGNIYLFSNNGLLSIY